MQKTLRAAVAQARGKRLAIEEVLEFLESTIDGASRRGGLLHAPATAPAPQGKKAVAMDTLSARAFRDAVGVRGLLA